MNKNSLFIQPKFKPSQPISINSNFSHFLASFTMHRLLSTKCGKWKVSFKFFLYFLLIRVCQKSTIGVETFFFHTLVFALVNERKLLERKGVENFRKGKKNWWKILAKLWSFDWGNFSEVFQGFSWKFSGFFRGVLEFFLLIFWWILIEVREYKTRKFGENLMKTDCKNFNYPHFSKNLNFLVFHNDYHKKITFWKFLISFFHFFIQNFGSKVEKRGKF